MRVPNILFKTGQQCEIFPRQYCFKTFCITGAVYGGRGIKLLYNAVAKNRLRVCTPCPDSLNVRRDRR